MWLRPAYMAWLVGLLALLSLPACRSEIGERQQAMDRNERQPTRSMEPRYTVITDPMLTGATAAGADWLLHGGAYSNQRYSTLDQINRENVGGLVPVWIYQTGIAESFVTTPLVVGNAMYLTTPKSHVVALNAATGKKLWEFTPQLKSVTVCCGPDNQGVAAYGDKIYVATLDGRVIALNHRTGEPVWETWIADTEKGYSQTMAPLAYDGKIFVGVGGSEYGVRGFVTALDAETGEEAWRWYTVPAPGDATNGWLGQWTEIDPFGTALNRDIAREVALSSKYPEAWERGGGAVRTTPAYDPATKTLYVTVGNPAPSLDGVIRPGDNLYTGSIVALDGATGTVRWHFQYLPHDVWDLSGGSPPFLFLSGNRQYLGHAGKTGWLYIVDAATGRPVLRSDNFVPQANLFTPPTEEGILVLPGANGGNVESPVAFSPRTGLAYVTGAHQPMVYSRAYQPREPGRLWLGGTFRFVPDQPQWGVLSAIDVRDGQIRWQRQVPTPMVGGALATAGDLVFVGQGTGSLDAFDAVTGELLWQFPAGAGVNGSPITFQIDTVQYVAVAAGGHYQLDTPRGDDVIVFALFDKRPPPVPTPYPEPRYARFGPLQHGAARQVPAARTTPRAIRPRGTVQP